MNEPHDGSSQFSVSGKCWRRTQFDMSRSAEARAELYAAKRRAAQQNAARSMMSHQQPYRSYQQQMYYYQHPVVPGYPVVGSQYMGTGSGQQVGMHYDAEEDDILRRTTAKMRMHGNTEKYNLNPLLANCIQNHVYYRRLSEDFGNSFQLLFDEASKKVTDLQPWQHGTQRTPSTAFCVLVRLCDINLHRGHVDALLKAENAYVQCLGFLYLRYVAPPPDLWQWFEKALKEDDGALVVCGKQEVTVAHWLESLLTTQKYYGTILPRIPVKIEREIKVKLVLLQEARQRAKNNATKFEVFTKGTEVRAIYADEHTEAAWFHARIDEVPSSTKKPRHLSEFLVTYPEYGNQELVWIGNIELLQDHNPSNQGKISPEAGSTAATSTKIKDQSSSKRSRSCSPSPYSSDASSHSYRRDRYRPNERREKNRRRYRSLSSDSASSRDENRRNRRRHNHRSRDEYYSKGHHRPSYEKKDGARIEGSSLAGDRLERVIHQQREDASSHTDYARRPQSYKEALALKVDRYTERRRSPDRGRRRID